MSRAFGIAPNALDAPPRRREPIPIAAAGRYSNADPSYLPPGYQAPAPQYAAEMGRVGVQNDRLAFTEGLRQQRAIQNATRNGVIPPPMMFAPMVPGQAAASPRQAGAAKPADPLGRSQAFKNYYGDGTGMSWQDAVKGADEDFGIRERPGAAPQNPGTPATPQLSPRQQQEAAYVQGIKDRGGKIGTKADIPFTPVAPRQDPPTIAPGAKIPLSMLGPTRSTPGTMYQPAPMPPPGQPRDGVYMNGYGYATPLNLQSPSFLGGSSGASMSVPGPAIQGPATVKPGDQYFGMGQPQQPATPTGAAQQPKQITAVDRKTGKRVRWDGKEWKPM